MVKSLHEVTIFSCCYATLTMQKDTARVSRNFTVEMSFIFGHYVVTSTSAHLMKEMVKAIMKENVNH